MKTVITGAAHGLGRALAEEALQRGHDVLAVDFDADALAGLATETLTLDVTARDAGVKVAEAAPINLIIHCAGISGTGPFERIPPEHHRKILTLNFEAPMAITASLLAQRAMAASSTHAFVGSLSTFTGYPGAVSYAASKDGMASFARSLDKSLPRGQRAACVFPGPMATAHAARYAPENSDKTVEARQQPEEAARLIFDALSKGRRTIVPGGKARALATLGKLVPGLVGKMLKTGLYDKLPDPKL